MIAWRILLAIPGLVALGYGVSLIWAAPRDDLPSALTWLIGGVVLHDGVLAPVVVGLGLVATRWLPAPWRAPAVVGLVGWGSLSLIAIPVLTGYGVDPPNESLQHRPYVTSWWILTVATLALVVLVGGWRLIRHSRLAADELDEPAGRGRKAALAPPDQRHRQPNRGMQRTYVDGGPVHGGERPRQDRRGESSSRE